MKKEQERGEVDEGEERENEEGEEEVEEAMSPDYLIRLSGKSC